MNTLFSPMLGAIAYRIIIAVVFQLGLAPTDLRLFTAITVARKRFFPCSRRI